MRDAAKGVVGVQRVADDLLERTVGSLIEDHQKNLAIAYAALAAQEELVRRIEDQLGGDPVGWATIVVRTKHGTRMDSFPVGDDHSVVRQGYRFSVDDYLYVQPIESGASPFLVGMNSRALLPVGDSETTAIVTWCDTREHGEDGFKRGVEAEPKV